MKKIILLVSLLTFYASNATAWVGGVSPFPYYEDIPCEGSWAGTYVAANGVAVSFNGGNQLNVYGSSYTMTNISCYLSEDPSNGWNDVVSMDFDVNINGTSYYAVFDEYGNLYY